MSKSREISGHFCERSFGLPSKAFDARSFRWKKQKDSWLLVGCPRGAWNARVQQCRSGMRAYKQLRPRRGRACAPGGVAVLKGAQLQPLPKLPAYLAGGARVAARAGSKTVCAPTTGKYTTYLCMTRTGAPSAPLRRPEDACALLRNAAKADRESFYVLALNNQSQVVGIEEVAKGTLGSVQVHPRELFKAAFVAPTAAIILAHNHPSGVQEPSWDDLTLTRKVNTIGRLLGVPIRDHVIVSSKGCASLRAMGVDASWAPDEKFV